jgi:hypothetical protein
LEAKVLRILLALAAILLIATSCGANNATLVDTPARNTSVVNATDAWNSVCAQYRFIQKPSDPTVTFSQGYYGGNFIVDFAAITARVNVIVGLFNVQQPTTGSDVMKARIENWGLFGGGGLL